jgi:predicted nucleic acid-binding protein
MPEMRNVVVDASVVVSALCQQDKRSRAAVARLDAGDVMHAPALLDFEVLHAVRRFLATDVQMTAERADATLDVLERLPIQRVPMHRALARRAGAHFANLSAYDASYVALAESIDATLLTADLRVANAPGIACAIEVIG